MNTGNDASKIRYTIGEVSDMTDISIDTLRFYEKTGVTGKVQRDSGGKRIFSEEDLAWLEFVCRVKNTGMPLEQIRKYRQLLLEGVQTSPRRRDIMVEHKILLEKKLKELNSALDLINYKIKYYDDVMKEHGFL